MAAIPQQQISPTVSAEDLSALQRVVERFDRTQLIWSSGYLAGLAGSTAPVAVADEPTVDTWHVFYATETGNSRQVAQQLVNNAETAGQRARLHDLRDTRPKVLKNIQNGSLFSRLTALVSRPKAARRSSSIGFQPRRRNWQG